jgi:hypothetical protein
MSVFITGGAFSVKDICIVVYQGALTDTREYKNAASRLHLRDAMGTDAARNSGAKGSYVGIRLQNQQTH